MRFGQQKRSVKSNRCCQPSHKTLWRNIKDANVADTDDKDKDENIITFLLEAKSEWGARFLEKLKRRPSDELQRILNSSTLCKCKDSYCKFENYLNKIMLNYSMKSQYLKSHQNLKSFHFYYFKAAQYRIVSILR